MLERYLKALKEEVGFEYEKKDDKLFYLNDVTLKEPEDGKFYLFSKLGQVPKEKKDDLFLYLMQANLLGQGTGLSTLGISDDEKSLTLSLSLPYEVNYREFKEILEEFLNYQDYWRKEIVRFEKGA